MKKKLMVLMALIGIFAGVMTVSLIYWSQENLAAISIDNKIKEINKIIANSLEVVEGKVNSYRLIQTTSEELDTAINENDLDSIQDELVTMINQSENVAGFNIEELRVFLLEKDQLKHKLSIHDPNENRSVDPEQQEKSYISKFHKEAYNVKIKPVSGINFSKKPLFTLIHYLSVFNFETGEVEKEGVMEIGVNFVTLLEAIKRNFNQTEVALFQSGVKISTSNVFFDTFESNLNNIELTLKESKSELFEDSEKKVRFNFIPLYDWNKEQKGYFIIAQDETDYQSALSDGRWVVISISLIFTILGILTAYFAVRKIINPLFAMIKTIKVITTGDFSERVEVTGNDEVAELGKQINEFIKKIETIVNKINVSSKSLSLSSIQLSSSTDEMNNTAKEIAASTGRESTEIGQMVSTIQEIAASIELNTKQIQNMKDAAVSADEEARHGNEAVNKTNITMIKIEESSQKIEGIIGVITEIANQTNLLSLNAAIEAAKAGDVGKGFAVVAEEVRNLAKRSSVSVVEIRNVIEQSAATVQDGISVTKMVEKVLNKIIGSVDLISTQVGEVADSMLEQDKATQEVSMTAESISSASAQNSTAAMELSNSTEEIASTADGLNHIAEQLNDHVSFFKFASR